MLRLPSAWTWDFWLADDGELHHLFFLKASRALLDPDRRHWRATIGHAVSTDLTNWTEVSDALVPADSPAWDDLSTWTGSVVRGDDGLWRMFYTGVSRGETGLVQRIGMATSDDLYVWHRHGTEPLLDADSRWYERLSDQSWPDEAWRDPWILREPNGPGWHMLLTARSRSGTRFERGVIGHATSPDLLTWTAQPPLTAGGHGFGQLEVPQYCTVDGRDVLLFSCLGSEMDGRRRTADNAKSGGIWAAPADGPLGPFDIEAAYRLTNESFYAGRLVQDRSGHWQLLAFRNWAPDGSFLGELADPMSVEWDPDGRLVLSPTPAE